MRKKWLALVLAVSMVISFAACSPVEPELPLKSQQSADWQRPEPGENYYGYVNFEYLTTTQIPYGKSGIGSFDRVGDEMEDCLSEIISQCSEKSSGDVFETAVREIYLQYLDEETRESVGITPLQPAVAMIESCQTTDELVKALGAVYQQYGVSSFFRFHVDSDFYDSSVNKLFLYNMNTCGNMKENFTKTDNGPDSMGSLLEKVFAVMEVDPKESRQRAKNTVSLINDIMQSFADYFNENSVEEHYFPHDKKQFAKLMSNINTDELFRAFGFETDEIIVYDLPQAEKINEVFTQENLRQLKDYSILCLFFQYNSVLPLSYVSEQKSLKKEEIEKKARNYIATELLEQEIGMIYGRKICTDEVMTAANKMLNDLKESCRSLIQNCERLSDDGKNKLITKLDNIIFLVGYNDKYTMTFQVIPANSGGNLMENAIAAAVAKEQEMKKKLNQPVDRKIWGMSPIEVNAVYNPYVNTVTIPAVMLSQAQFDPSDGEYKNLGKLGYVIAHEMNHAFDSHGVLFNETGCYNPHWLSDEDQAAYTDFQQKAKEYYNHYKILDVYNIDGELTLSENIADLGAVQCISNLTDDKEELRQIFEGVAEGWASISQVTDVLMQLSGDLHSPSEARVNAVLSSSDKFYEAYDIKETDKMYVAPENRVKVW